MRRSTRTIALAVGSSAAAAGLILTAVPADAAILRGGVDQVDDTYVQECEQPDGSIVQIVVHDVGTVRWVNKVRGPLAGFSYLDPWYSAGLSDIHSTYTNPQTGRSWTTDYSSTDKDRKVVAVVGTVQTLVAQRQNHFVINDESGRMDRRSDNHVEWTFTFDTRGTEDESDDVSEFVSLDKVAGTTDAGSFCDDAYRFTIA
jgi:hypothetical protein